MLEEIRRLRASVPPLEPIDAAVRRQFSMIESLADLQAPLLAHQMGFLERYETATRLFPQKLTSNEKSR